VNPPRRLPINVAPARHETVVSYLARLANLHGMPYDHLEEGVTNRISYQHRYREVVAERMTHLTGRTLTHLGWALPELRDPAPDWRIFRHEPQPACPACAARHPGGPVFVILPHHRYVCLRHRYWIGPPDTALPSPPLNDLPEIVTAQQAHHRLLRRYGWAITYDAILTGFMFCGWFWEKHDRQFDMSMIDTVFDEWIRRTAILIPPGTANATFTASKLFAVTYPEAVKIAGLVASPHWRAQANGTVAQKRNFAAELARHLQWSRYQPKTVYDPVAHWMEYDAGQPPSSPAKTFPTIRGFKTPQQIDAHYEGKLANRHASAAWFSRNNKGGNAILHHRHIRSVLIRDWSTPMQDFVGSIWASQYTPRTNTPRWLYNKDTEDYLPAE